MKKKRSKKTEEGLTLVEILVVTAVFTVVVVISMGAIMQMLAVNQKVRSMSMVMDNLSSGMEIMTIQLRYGIGYDCDSPTGCESITFDDYEGNEIEYFLDEDRIWRTVDNGTPQGLSDPEATIESLHFYVFGESLVLVSMRGRVGRDMERSEFSLQTAVARRQR